MSKLFIAIFLSTTFLFTACGLHEKPGPGKEDQVEANKQDTWYRELIL